MSGRCVFRCFRFGPLLVAAFGLASALASLPARALDGLAFELGLGSANVRMGRAALQWDWKPRLLQGSDWHVGGYWEASLGYWDHDQTRTGQNDELYEFAFTPVFRLQPNGVAGPYGEAGVGAHLLSHNSIGDRRFSTAFQFGTLLGVGYRFGTKSAYDVGYRFQHLSNADIKTPNPGINFHQLRVQYHF